MKLSLLLITIIFASCSVTRTTVGDGPIGRKKTNIVYSSTKQMYLFAGLIKLGNFQPLTPDHTNFQVKTSSNFVDGLIAFGTAGVITTRTITIIVEQGAAERYMKKETNVIEEDALTKKRIRSVVQLTKRGNNVFVEIPDGTLDIDKQYFTEELNKWGYWHVVDDIKDADFIIEINTSKLVPNDFVYFVFKNNNNKEFMRTKKYSAKKVITQLSKSFR